MTDIVKTAAYAASKSLGPYGSGIKRSHLSEVLAAMLGYRTFSALAMEEKDSELEFHLDDAELLVLNQAMAEQRALELRISSLREAMQACLGALMAAAESKSIAVYVGAEDFWNSYARPRLASAISSSREVMSAMSETNADFNDDPELQDWMPSLADLWTATDMWSISAEARMEGEHDFRNELDFMGDTLECDAELFFEKAGRAGLRFAHSRCGATVDDSWHLEGFYDEEDETELGL